MKRIKGFVSVIALLVLAFLVLLLFYKSNNYKYKNYGKLYINEIMASNTYTIKDNNDKYSDFIEIYNGYDYDINLQGYYLSDDDFLNTKWSFPDVEIKKGEYLLVYADSLNKCDNNICHTNFKLDKKGETITLSNKKGEILSKISYEQTEHDTSYGYNNNEYVYYYKATPGYGNDSEHSKEPIRREQANINLKITEYMNNNEKSFRDKENDIVNFVELFNGSDENISLKGFYLSDKENKINRYSFPDITIKGKEYLVVYLSGKDKYENGEVHTNFKLSTSDKVLVLSSNKGELIDKVYLESLSKNISSGLYNDSWVYYTNISPGKKNGSKNYDDILAINSSKKLIINEVTAVDNNAIEIKNISSETINLKNYGISDKKSNIAKFPEILIKPGAYVVVYGSDYYNYSYGKLYTGFKVSSTDEVIYLYDNNNYVIDEFKSGLMPSGTSYGINEEGNRVLYNNVTLGYANSKSYYNGYSEIVKYSKDGGYVDANTKITLRVSDDSSIFYTTDGSYPSANSSLYTEPITITKTTVLKTISSKEEYLPSEITSRTFFVGRNHDLPVISLSTDDNNLYNSKNGLFTHERWNLEKKISFEFYENDGSFGTNFNGGVKFVGQDSRSYPQKSMAIYLRKKYGLQEVTYPFFEDSDAVTTFSSFVLRNSGEDVNYLKLKDSFLIATIKDQMDLDFQYYRAVVVYINGKYWGLYNIREKINESYLKNNHGVDEDNVDLIKGNNDVRAGSMTNYRNLINYIKTHDVTNAKVYEYLKTQIDVQELANYWVVQTYYANTDTGNIRFWRENTDTGKWRWALFDLDWSMWPSTYKRVNLFYPFLPYGHGTRNGFSTTLTYYLYKNKEFRDLYLTTFAYHMKNTFIPERLTKILDEMVDTIDNEMPYHIKRWYNDFVSSGKSPLASMTQWNSRLNTMRSMITNRYSLVKAKLKSEFKLSESDYQKYFGDL